jgi:hypothetical protein
MKNALIFGSIVLLNFLFACGTKERNNTSLSDAEIVQLGDSLSRIAQQTLLQNVGKAMQNGGPVNAVDFCNIHVSSIMDSLSREHNVTFGRLARKNRNQKNAMTMEESRLLRPLEKGFKNDTLVNMGNKRVYYKAIRIEMPACLQCHGTKDDISAETLEIIKKKYPADRATDFKMGDYRGTWKLVFE